MGSGREIWDRPNSAPFMSFAWCDTFSSAVADMQKIHGVQLDGEEYAVKMRFPSVKELTDFKRKTCTFGAIGHRSGNSANDPKASSSAINQSMPVCPGVLREKPFQDCLGVAFSLSRNFNAKCHSSGVYP